MKNVMSGPLIGKMIGERPLVSFTLWDCAVRQLCLKLALKSTYICIFSRGRLKMQVCMTKIRFNRGVMQSTKQRKCKCITRLKLSLYDADDDWGNGRIYSDQIILVFLKS